MMKKEMIAMLLAGGQGSRLGVLTAKVAKPAVAFGGKYRIIDFPLSNCINSGVDTVGVLTQYQPLRLNSHIGIGIPWDLDRNVGGVSILPPYEKSGNSEWYTGTANAIFQNLDYMQQYNPDYVLILSGDHIYKMDYEVMLNYHKANKADVTIACMPVPIEEASRFGIMVTDETGRVAEFEEKPEKPSSNLASMGIYIFSWPVLKEALIALKDQSNCDFGKHILPYCKDKGQRLFAYEYNGYWKDVGTLGSYWEANMELIDIIPEFNLYEEFWKIYTKGDIIPPQYIAGDAVTDQCLIGEGAEIYGEVHHSVIGPNVVIGRGTVVRDSIIMRNSQIGEDTVLDKAIVAEDVVIGNKVTLGFGEEAANVLKPAVYAFGLATVGERSVIPDNVQIGRNTAISGVTTAEDYPGGILESGLDKVAVYEEWAKRKALKAGNLAFASMFMIGVVAIIIQMLLTVDIRFVLGETISVLAGGILYAAIMVYNGIWDKCLPKSATIWRDFLTSVICAEIFSAIYGVCLLRMGATETQITRLALEFLIGITIVAFIILRILAFINQKKNQRPANDQDEKAASLSKMEYIKIYNAQNIVETEQIMEMLKQNGIVAFSQEPGANVAMHVVSGFGIYGVDIFVKTDDAEKAAELVKEIRNQENE